MCVCTCFRRSEYQCAPRGQIPEYKCAHIWAIFRLQYGHVYFQMRTVIHMWEMMRNEEEEEDQEESLFKADAVNEEDPERDRATQVSKTRRRRRRREADAKQNPYNT